MKCFVKDPPETASVLPELALVKPVVDSVSFHRYGKEIAITVTGDNLWFCNKVKVGTLTQSINAEDISQKELQFYRNFEDITSISSTSDHNHIKVRIWNHFSKPVSNPEATVKHKVSIKLCDIKCCVAIAYIAVVSAPNIRGTQTGRTRYCV